MKKCRHERRAGVGAEARERARKTLRGEELFSFQFRSEKK